MQLVVWTPRTIAGAIVAAFVMTAAGICAVNAQQSQNPSVSVFLANPEQLLQQYPNGGSQLSNAAQELALADPSTFKVLLGLTEKASDQQKGALAAGLAQATKVEVLTNQTVAAEWQQLIAAITDPTFKTAATNAFGDVQLGAVGGGSIGAPGSGLGGPGNGPTIVGGTPQNPQTPTFTKTGTTTTTTVSTVSSVSLGVSP